MASRIFIFSIAVGAEYLSHVNSIATFALTFIGYIILVLASVPTYLLTNFPFFFSGKGAPIEELEDRRSTQQCWAKLSKIA